jgi:hypothetical protein
MFGKALDSFMPDEGGHEAARLRPSQCRPSRATPLAVTLFAFIIKGTKKKPSEVG